MSPTMDRLIRLWAIVFPGTRLEQQGGWRLIRTEGYDEQGWPVA